MNHSRIYLSPPHMSGEERELLLAAFDSNWIAPLGPHVEAFEREFAERIGMSEAVALSSGTAALHLSLILLGVGSGDEVLTSTLTFAATANAITYVGAKPVFIDSDRRSWNMDPALLAEEIESCLRRGVRPKAVIAVDLYGQCADYEPIQEICRRHDIPLIEDAAEALGAEYRGRPAGVFGEIACFSFNGNKIITTSGGGMLVARRKELVERARYLATQARSGPSLPAFPDWIQLSHEQPAGCRRAGAVASARTKDSRAPGEFRILPPGPGRPARDRFHARIAG